MSDNWRALFSPRGLTESDRDYAIRMRRANIAGYEGKTEKHATEAVEVWTRQIAELEKLPVDASFTDVLDAVRKETR